MIIGDFFFFPAFHFNPESSAGQKIGKYEHAVMDFRRLFQYT
ncbi:Uncharacterised protein [Paenibacillus macerans]|nr:Uncharacterised protein [Paenibacillus macerans]